MRSGSKPTTTPFEPTEHPTTALGTVEHTTVSLHASATTERHDRDEQIEALHDQTLLVSWPGSPLAWRTRPCQPSSVKASESRGRANTSCSPTWRDFPLDQSSPQAAGHTESCRFGTTERNRCRTHVIVELNEFGKPEGEQPFEPMASCHVLTSPGPCGNGEKSHRRFTIHDDPLCCTKTLYDVYALSRKLEPPFVSDPWMVAMRTSPVLGTTSQPSNFRLSIRGRTLSSAAILRRMKKNKLLRHS